MKIGQAISNSSLVYPVTLNFENLVVKWYDANQRINQIKGMASTQTIITQAANIVKDEIKNLKYQMSWPPQTDELNISNFINPPKPGFVFADNFC